MFSTNATYYLLRCLDEEIVNAEKWGKTYASNHEAYAVLKEEVEEVGEDVEILKSFLDDYWRDIRDDVNENQMHADVKNLKDIAYAATKELVQVMAVCYKTLATLEKKE